MSLRNWRDPSRGWWKTREITTSLHCSPAQRVGEPLLFVEHLARYPRTEGLEEGRLIGRCLRPVARLDRDERFHRLIRNGQAGQIDCVGCGHDANGPSLAVAGAVAPLEDPLHPAQILAETGPDEFSASVSTDAVHAKDFWWL